jgi:hypothetical protein
VVFAKLMLIFFFGESRQHTSQRDYEYESIEANAPTTTHHDEDHHFGVSSRPTSAFNPVPAAQATTASNQLQIHFTPAATVLEPATTARISTTCITTYQCKCRYAPTT